MNEDDAAQSVEALAGDVRHIMGSRPHANWPDMAEAALAHHDPPIPERLLSEPDRRRQRAVYQMLRGLRDSNERQIRIGILALKSAESDLSSAAS